jgi:Xaa-Pro aminopeptidase
VTVTVEPGIYLPGFGVRSEINVHVDETGPRVTTREQQEITLIA